MAQWCTPPPSLIGRARQTLEEEGKKAKVGEGVLGSGQVPRRHPHLQTHCTQIRNCLIGTVHHPSSHRQRAHATPTASARLYNSGSVNVWIFYTKHVLQPSSKFTVFVCCPTVRRPQSKTGQERGCRGFEKSWPGPRSRLTAEWGGEIRQCSRLSGFVRSEFGVETRCLGDVSGCAPSFRRRGREKGGSDS